MHTRLATQIVTLLLSVLLIGTHGQRVAPGVAPQQYQQVPGQQQQYQQHPAQQQQYQQQHAPGVAPQQYQQQQQQHVQYQQVPVQQQAQHHQQQQQQQQFQQPQQQMQQQQPIHGGHHQQQVLNAANVEHERAHIQEHMQVPIDTSKMSEAELQFHYFKMHDTDNNNKLDGCELIKSLIHWHDQGSKQPQNGEQPHVEEKVFSDEELVALIDPILQLDDTSHDGYIDYPEFIKAQQKSAEKHQQEQQQQQQQQHQQQQQQPTK